MDNDPLLDEAVRIVCQYDRASASLLQRKLSIGYARAARLMDTLGDLGIVGPGEGSKPRDVLVRNSDEYFSARGESPSVSKVNMENTSTDPVLEEAIRIVCQYDQASASLLQRKLDIGYARAARLLDLMEGMGVVGVGEGSKPRDVLISSFKEFEKNKGTLIGKIKNSPEYEFKPPAYYPPRFDSKKLGFDPKLYQVPLGAQNKNSAVVYFDHLETMGQLLVTGMPQSLKMNLIDLILFSQLISATPDQLKVILFDTFGRLKIFDGLSHLLTPVINDPDKLLSALKWTIAEMQRRGKILNSQKTRNLPTDLPRILLVLRFNFKMDSDHKEALRIITSEGTSLGIHTILVEDLDDTTYVPKEIRSNFLHHIVFKTETPEARGLDLNEFLLKTMGDDKPQKLKIVSLPENWQDILTTMTTPPEGYQDKNDLIKFNAAVIEKTLESFNITARIAELQEKKYTVEYRLEIALGTKLEDITKREKDIALAVASPSGHVKIVAPIPGRSLVGITIPIIPKKLEDVDKVKMLSSWYLRRLSGWLEQLSDRILFSD